VSEYKLALFAHIVGVLALFIAIGIEWMYLRLIRGADTVERLQTWGALSKGLDKLFPLSTVVIIGSGLYLVQKYWGWDAAWIKLGFGALVIMSIVGPAVNTRRFHAIGLAVASTPHGPIPPALARQVHDTVLLTSVQTLAALAVGVVYLHIMKPNLTESLVALAVAVAAGLLISAYSIMRAGVVQLPVTSAERQWQ